MAETAHTAAAGADQIDRGPGRGQQERADLIGGHELCTSFMVGGWEVGALWTGSVADANWPGDLALTQARIFSAIVVAACGACQRESAARMAVWRFVSSINETMCSAKVGPPALFSSNKMAAPSSANARAL